MCKLTSKSVRVRVRIRVHSACQSNAEKVLHLKAVAGRFNFCLEVHHTSQMELHYHNDPKDFSIPMALPRHLFPSHMEPYIIIRSKPA